MTTKHFRIAFSFAGEKREFVAKVAAILAKRFGKSAILYDKYHEAPFARSDLGIHLPDLYHDESDLVVLVICKDYESKEWCGLEWTAIHALIKERKVEDVMLCRFDQALIKGLYSTAGFVELDRKSPDEVAKLIIQRLKANGVDITKRKRPPKSLVGAAEMRSTPNNLPRLQYFFGRDTELKKIADALSPEARGWGALIDGPGGIGKTSLAIRAAEFVPDGRFRRIIFLSSKERELTADGQRSLGSFVLPSYLEMLNAIARELDQSDLTNSTEEERPTVILRALQEADVLLVLDNLETLPEFDRDQIFAFLNRLPRGCSAIVTSRRRADASAVIVRLDRLDWNAARELIIELGRQYSRLGHAGETERRALYEETGGNPLLIRWIAGQLGIGRCRDISAALDFLRSAPPANNPLEFIFGDLLDTFSTNETNVLAALTYFTLPIEAKFIAELGGISEAAAQTALGDLASRALVLPDVEERSFILVPMVADFLRRKRPEVVAQTGSRLEEHAYALIVENCSQNDRFPVLNAAWLRVAPALPLFVAGPNPRLQRVCNTLFQFHNFTGHYDESLWLNERAEAKALAVHDYFDAGRRAVETGWFHSLRKQAEQVLACSDRAASHWGKAKAGTRERSLSIRLRGIGYHLQKDYPKAIAAFREALDLRETLATESKDVSVVLNDLAKAELASGDYAAAERDFREALRISRALDYFEGVVAYTGNLATLMLDRENWLEAEALAREALPMAEKVGRLQLIADVYYALAKALVRQGKPAEALPHARRAVDIFTHLGVASRIEDAREALEECED
jgi:tetratricopeptide (TPR) repeat protein